MARPRVALLIPYWGFWATSTREDVRTVLGRTASEIASALEGVEVVSAEILYTAEEANSVAARLRSSSPDVLLIAQTMAVSPARTAQVVDSLSEIPLVVWALNTRPSVGSGFNHSDIMTEGATVGTSQLVNLLVRQDRPLALHVGHLRDPRTVEGVSSSIASAAAAGRLSRATLARIGDPPEGYDCVVCDFSKLGSTVGLSILELPPNELVHAYKAVKADALEELALEMRNEFRVAPSLHRDDEGLRRSLRFAAALEQLDTRLGIDAGAINCHIDELRYSPTVGIAPCFALGRETSRGIPWSCAGDVLTAVAMLTTKLLGGGALYHELERIDFENDEIIIANSGEHDLAVADPADTPELRANGWFASDPICGVCACFSARPGPATLVAFTPHPREASGFRYVIAEGEFTGRSLPRTGTPNAGFRFSSCSAADGYRAWALAGANHHSSCTAGHLSALVGELAMHLGVGVAQVG